MKNSKNPYEFVISRNSHLFDLTKYDLKMGIMTGACRELGHNGVNVGIVCLSNV